MSKKDTKTQTTEREKYALWIDHDLLKRLRNYHEEVGVPVSESIRRAIEAYVKTLPRSR
jgi:predicted DNA-binding protein